MKNSKLQLRLPFPFRYFEPNGYGAVTRGFIGGLTRLGVDIRVPNIDYSKYTDQAQFNPSADEAAIWNEVRSRPDDLSIARSLQISVPHAFKICGEKSFLYTMTERENWVERYSTKNWFSILNTPGAIIITPTQWNKSVWEDAGVTSPIEVAPCGIDYLKFQNEKMLLERNKFKKFTFFSVFNGLGDPSSREQWKLVMNAMEHAFSDDEGIQWIVKTNKVHPDFVPSSKISMRIIEDPSLSESQMTELYTSSHAFVKNSVEGWGMPTMEAMALGLPVIHSYNTAPMEYLNDANSFLHLPNDLETLVKHLKFVRHNYSSDTVKKCIRAADTTAKAYNWEAASLKLISIIFNDS